MDTSLWRYLLAHSILWHSQVKYYWIFLWLQVIFYLQILRWTWIRNKNCYKTIMRIILFLSVAITCINMYCMVFWCIEKIRIWLYFYLKENGNLWCFGTFKYGVATHHNPAPGHSMLVYAISKSLFDGPIVKIACGWTHCLVKSGSYIKESVLFTVY